LNSVVQAQAKEVRCSTKESFLTTLLKKLTISAETSKGTLYLSLYPSLSLSPPLSLLLHLLARLLMLSEQKLKEIKIDGFFIPSVELSLCHSHTFLHFLYIWNRMSFLSASGGDDRERLDEAEDVSSKALFLRSLRRFHPLLTSLLFTHTASQIGYLPPTVEDPAEEEGEGEGEGEGEAVAPVAGSPLPNTPRRTTRDGEAATLATAAGASAADGEAASDDQNESVREVPDWPLYDKHIFILSNAGKPIYTRYVTRQGHPISWRFPLQSQSSPLLKIP
jgi:hypothetical protein